MLKTITFFILFFVHPLFASTQNFSCNLYMNNSVSTKDIAIDDKLTEIFNENKYQVFLNYNPADQDTYIFVFDDRDGIFSTHFRLDGTQKYLSLNVANSDVDLSVRCDLK
jgi:hypothetical protein